MPFPPRRTLATVLVTASVFSIAACGSEKSESAAETKPRLNLPPAQPEGTKTSVGLLVSVDQSSMTLKTKDGFETFIIRNGDRANLGLDHLRSHAGSDVGFEVFSEPGEEPDVRYVVGARETAAPAGVTLEPQR